MKVLTIYAVRRVRISFDYEVIDDKAVTLNRNSGINIYYRSGARIAPKNDRTFSDESTMIVTGEVERLRRSVLTSRKFQTALGDSLKCNRVGKIRCKIYGIGTVSDAKMKILRNEIKH